MHKNDDQFIEILNRFRTTIKIQWHLCISSLQPFRKTHTIIQSLNIRFLSLHFENIETYHNLQTYHILCLNETTITMQHSTSHPYANHPKYTLIEIYGSQGTMLLYD